MVLSIFFFLLIAHIRQDKQINKCMILSFWVFQWAPDIRIYGMFDLKFVIQVYVKMNNSNRWITGHEGQGLNEMVN
jgi:hypothetical protein